MPECEVAIDQSLPLLTRDKFKSKAGALKFVASLPLSTSGLYRALRAFKPDLIHSNTATLITPGPVAKLLGIPHVWHIREFFAEFPSAWPMFQKYMLAFSDRIICVSGAVQDQFTPRAKATKVTVITDGFPESPFAPVSPERVQFFRARFGLDHHRVVGWTEG